MSILFCTPAYGGMVHAAHFRSCLNLKEEMTKQGIEHDWLVGWNESLVQRARNLQAAQFLETGYQKMMFIDADIEFEPEAVAKLWNLDAPVAVGLYPMKRKDAPPLSAWRHGKLVELSGCPEGPFEVDYAGTGFMLIDRSVLEKMRAAWPEREHDEGATKSFLWFDPRLSDDGSFYLSEDYAFCRDYRALGGKIVADPSIKLLHWGNCAYGDA